MSFKVHALLASLALTALAGRADDFVSPNRRFMVRTGSVIEITDRSGKPLVQLVGSTKGLERIRVSWSPDSKRVAVAANERCDCKVIGAWQQGPVWGKALQSEAYPQLGTLIALNGPLQCKQNNVLQWVSSDTVLMNGLLIFGNGNSYVYKYRLKFKPMSIKGINYQIAPFKPRTRKWPGRFFG